jgi:hypothetical protein
MYHILNFCIRDNPNSIFGSYIHSSVLGSFSLIQVLTRIVLFLLPLHHWFELVDVAEKKA